MLKGVYLGCKLLLMNSFIKDDGTLFIIFNCNFLKSSCFCCVGIQVVKELSCFFCPSTFEIYHSSLGFVTFITLAKTFGAAELCLALPKFLTWNFQVYIAFLENHLKRKVLLFLYPIYSLQASACSKSFEQVIHTSHYNSVIFKL